MARTKLPAKQPRPSRAATQAPKKSVTLTEAAYRRLARDIKSIAQASESALSSEKLGSYWRIGARVAREKLHEEAGYHNSLLRDLSADSGIAIRTLQESVAFRAAYPAVPRASSLTWSHFRLLSRLESKKERDYYERLCIEKSFGARELTRALASGLFQGGQLGPARLARPTNAQFLYAARTLAIVDADTFDLDVDLGFHCWTKQRVRLASVDASEFGSAPARAARNFAVDQLASAKTLVIQSLKTDVHGRFVVHLFYSPATVEILDCFQNGFHFNDVLLQAGHAALVP